MNYIKEQIKIVMEKDPSISNAFEVLLCPSFKALIYYKISKFSILPLKFNSNSYIIFLEREQESS